MKWRGMAVLVCAVSVMSSAVGGARRAADDETPTYREHQDLSYYVDAAGERHSIQTPADWQKRREHVVAHMQAVMGNLPGEDKKAALELKVEEEARIGDVIRRKVTYQTIAGRRVAAYLFLPADGGNAAAAADKRIG